MIGNKKFIGIGGLILIGVLVSIFLYPNKRSAKGDKQYGGTLKLSSKNELLNLFPLADNTLEHHRAQQLVFEPLLKANNSEKGWRYFLAKKIEPITSQKKFRIHLRKNIYFSDDPCFRFSSSELTAEDVAFSLSLACAQTDIVKQDLLLPKMLLGGMTFYQKKKDPLRQKPIGIRIIDKHTLEITLTKDYNHFLNVLTSPSLCVLSKQAYQYYGKAIVQNPVGTGPFLLQSKKKNKFLFERNSKYWRFDKYGNQLPFLNNVEIQCGIQGQMAHQLFAKNKLDLLFDLPVDELQEAFGTLDEAQSGKNPLHEVYIKNAAKTHFLQFNCMKGAFKDPRVRKAFALVVDNNRICNEILKGEGRALNNRFIPKQHLYNNTLLLSDKSNLEEKIRAARILLQKAGYNKQNTFPLVTLYVGAEKETLTYKWTAAAAQMICSSLGVSIELKEEKINNRKQKYKSNSLWRTGWVGDYPGAESYLRLFYSGAQNPLVFDHIGVDAYYLESIRAQTQQQCRRAQMLCEKEIIEQQALIPIYTEDFIVLHPLRVRGFELDHSGLVDYARLYIKELK